MNDYRGFKFKPIKPQLLKSLEASEIFLANPRRLNDPFDCRVNIMQSLENAIKRSSGPVRKRLEEFRRMRHFLAKVQSDVENFGVFSMSLELENSLMWAH